MDYSDLTFELSSSGSDTPPAEAPPCFAECDEMKDPSALIDEKEKDEEDEEKRDGHVEPSHQQCTPLVEPTIKLEDLMAHAAVRFVEAGNYDDLNLPVLVRPQKKTSKFSLGRSFRSVASYLVSNVGPRFQERYIAVEECPTRSALFVVRHARQKSSNADVAAEELGDVVASFPLSRLVDVASFSVLKKDLFVFGLISGFLNPSSTNEKTAETNAPDREMPSFFSSSGDVGLQLVFKESPADFSVAKDQFRKVEIQFLSAKERDVWLRCLEEAYIFFLLESVRTGDGARLSAADVKGLVRESNRLLQEKPPPAVIERHIDFFLSSAGREVIDDSHETQVADPNDVPCGGILRIDLGDGHYEPRRFAYKKSVRYSSSGEEKVEQEYLVMYPTTVSQHVLMVPKHKVPISQLRVFVEEEHWGNAFFLEQTAEATDSQRKSLFGVCRSHLAKLQSAFTAPVFVGSNSASGFAITETIELQTNSFPNRIKWLKWFEAVLKRPVVYLSRVREEKEAEGSTRTPVRRANSLYPESMSPEAGRS